MKTRKKSHPLTRKKAKAVALRTVTKPIGRGIKIAVAEINPDAQFMGDSSTDATFDSALMGYVQKPCESFVACYDYEKCVDCLVHANGWDRADAIEWMEYNVVSAYLGPNTPVFFHRPIT